MHPPIATMTNMAYVPKTHPVFPADLQHDFRDFQLSRRLETLADWVGEASHHYLRAHRILRRDKTDALAIVLADDIKFDARTLWVVHDYMAAHWRAVHMPEALSGREVFTGPDDHPLFYLSYGALQFRFQRWLRHLVGLWAEHTPDVLHQFLLASVGEHTRSGQQREAELLSTLASLYAIPGVPTPQSVATEGA